MNKTQDPRTKIQAPSPKGKLTWNLSLGSWNLCLKITHYTSEVRMVSGNQ